MTSTALLGYLLLFVTVGVGFILVHLLAGKLVRPSNPDAEKLTIYECGEPTIGSAWIQFDVRYYVVALLFVIFDVEVAFFFPWAVVYGKVNALADTGVQARSEQLFQPVLEAQLADDDAKVAEASSQYLENLKAEADPFNRLVRDLVPPYPENKEALAPFERPSGEPKGSPTERASRLRASINSTSTAASQAALIGFFDILVFFGVLLVGFAYVWKRGDIDWVRSFAAEEPAASETALEVEELVGQP